MADMPAIFPMRFPSIGAPRVQTNIDELLPSTYMGQPTPFTSQLQNVGKMLQAKHDDLDQANEAALKFGPQVAPGQIAALNDFLFRRGGVGYGGVMSPDGTQALQVPDAAPATPFNTAGQVRAQTDAEQAATLAARKEAAAAQQQLLRDKLDQNQRQFEQRTKDRQADLAERTANHEHVNARLLNLGNRRLAQTAEGMALKRAADEASKRAGQAFSNARSFASQASALEKAMAADFTMTPEVKQQRQAELENLHRQADAEMQRGYELDAKTSRYVDQALGTESPAPAAPGAHAGPAAAPAPAVAPPARPTRPNGSKWFSKVELAAHPDALKQVPQGKDGGWFTPDGKLDTY